MSIFPLLSEEQPNSIKASRQVEDPQVRTVKCQTSHVECQTYLSNDPTTK